MRPPSGDDVGNGRRESGDGILHDNVAPTVNNHQQALIVIYRLD